jgi:anaerobic selenocysteine-containing dehydrogenase
MPPAPDELTWIATLGERFEVDIPPYAASAFEELSAQIYDGLPFAAIGEQAPLPSREAPPAEPVAPAKRQRQAKVSGLRLITYRPLFSGPAVERVPELQFQRPEPVLAIAYEDARAREIENDAKVEVSSNDTSAVLRARVSRKLPKGTVRAAEEHVRGLAHDVEVKPA